MENKNNKETKKIANNETSKNIVYLFIVVVVTGLLIAAFLDRKDEGSIPPGNTWQKTEGVVTIIEYSDFKCPFCVRGSKTIDQLKKEYGKKLDIQFRHFPLSFHEGAEIAAEASECARDQNKFWQYHDLLFDSTEKKIDVGERTVLDSIAGNVGLDIPEFSKCLDSRAKKTLVESHRSQSRSLGFSGTPSFIIEGEKIVGAQPIEKFKEIINSKLEEK